MATDITTESTTSVSDDLRDLSEGSDELEVQSPEEDTTDEEVTTEPEDDVEVPGQEEEEPEQETEEPEETPKDLELHPFDRPSLKSIEEKFPGFFKQFPSMRDMYFREAEYSKVFPTIDDAKEASENDTAFQEIRESVFQGNGSKFFSAIKEVSDKDLEKFSTTVLPTLFQVHPQSFWRAANPLVEDIAKNMFAKGQRDNNESLQNAARYLSDYFFGNTEIAEGKKTSIVKVEDNTEVIKEREKFDNERLAAFRSTVETDVRSQLVNLIESKDSKTGKSRLDPDGVFSNFIRTTIVDRIIEDLGTQLSSDKDHIRYMESLWNKSKQSGRTDADKTRIISAYLARAKSLIPSIRSKYVSEALGQKTRIASGKKNKVDETSSRTSSGTLGKGSSGGNNNYHPKSINYSKTSDTDILNDNITYK